MSEYVGEFVQESEESITELNNALLDLEQNPADDAAMERVFRTAHTLKGNCGAMGFDRASDLAHAIEDLLDAVRNGSLEITPDLMDEVFDAVDDLERMIAEVDRHGEVRSDPTERIETIRSNVEAAAGLVPPGEDEMATLFSAGGRLPRDAHDPFHVRLSLTPGEGNGEAVVAALEDAFDLLATDPDPATVRAESPATVDAVFGSAVGRDAVAAALEPVAAVEDAVVTAVSPEVVDRAFETTTSDEETVDDPEEMAVEDLLDEFDEYDDLDAAVQDAEDVPGLENMGEAGAFDDIVEEPPADASSDPTASESGTDSQGEGGPASVPTAAPDDEVEDAMGEFQAMQEEYDTVGLDEMEAELADVEFGEYDQDDEVSFEELIGEDLEEDAAGAATETDATADATAEAAVEPPDDDAVTALVEATGPPAAPGRGVHHARIGLSPGDAAAGTEVVEALRDAFDLLGTDPEEAAVAAGDHEGVVDALFGSDLPEDGIRSALVDVTPVAAVHLAEVTERVPPPSEAGDGASAAEGAADADAADGADTDDVEAAVVEAEGEIEDATSEFEQMQAAYDTVGLDEMEAELADVEFGEYDQDDEVSFEELIGEDLEEDADAEATATGAATDAGTTADGDLPAPTDEEVERAVAAADGTLPPDRDGYHVALAVRTAPDRNEARRVADALEDAFDLLDTRPPTAELTPDDDRLAAVLGSHVPESAIRTALDDVEAVGTVHLTEVTDRLRAAESAAETADASDDVADPMATFRELEAEYDAVAPEEIEAEIAETGIPGVNPETEVGFEELLDPVPAADTANADAAGDTETADADAGSAVESEAEAGAGTSPTADADDAPDAETADATSETATESARDADATANAAAESETGPPADADDAAEEEDEAEAEDEADVAVEEVTADELDEIEDVDIDDLDLGDDIDDATVSSDFGVDVDVDTGSVFGDDEGEATSPEADAEADSPAEPDTEPAVDPTEAEPVSEAATAAVDTIRGIGAGYSERLADAGVEDVADLVRADPETLSAETDIGEARIAEWIDRAPVTAADLPGAAASAEPEPTPDVDATEAETDRAASEAIQSIRVDVDQVDRLLNLVEELVTSRARMRRALGGDETEMDRQALSEELDELDVVGTEMQDVVMDMRLVPVRTVTQRLPRVVRDVARDQGKQVDFEIEGEDVEVDRSILSRMDDPLIHMVRNAVDHGIESPEERTAAGKPETGQVTLRAYRSRDTVYVEVEDDGRGLDPDSLREAAVEKGLYTAEEADRVSDQSARELVFQPGFSTTEEVTDVSGRGVGMDVVASTVEDLDGDVEIESEVGEGTTVRLALPVSVAISEVLFMQVGDEEYGVPIRVVDEIEGMSAAQVATDGGVADGGATVRTDAGEERELIDLGEEMDAAGRTPDRSMGGPEERGMLVTIEDDVRRAAIHCDQVRGQQEVVVKPFEGFMADIPGLSGAAILGEGAVVNILDVETL